MTAFHAKPQVRAAFPVDDDCVITHRVWDTWGNETAPRQRANAVDPRGLANAKKER